MYLKSLELYGFKSFAERTKIEFNDNITCIVGPNGSGKSNITDAIKWVMGEQSTTTLRGTKMQDVIFAGTDDRRALGMAEVIITFDNSAGIFDIDYSEVEVRRKLYKNGDSEYSINNNKCRLKDIRELFMDTGMGHSGYSIIGQGRIDAILNSKPEERRLLFEEASGIAKNKSQKEEVERKLKKTEENIIRLSDILKEIETQKNTLERESKIAIKYEEIYKELLKSEFLYSASEILKLKEELITLKVDRNKLYNLKNSILSEVESLHKENEKNSNNLEDIELKISNLQIENIENIRLEKSLSSEITLDKEKISNSTRSINDLNTRVEISRKDNENYIIELDDYREEIDSTNRELEEKNKILDKLNIEISKIDKKIKTLREDEEKLLEKVNQDNKIYQDNKIKLSTLENLMIDKKNSTKDLELELKKFNLDLEEILSEEKEITSTYKSIEEKHNEKLFLRNNIQKSLDSLRVESTNTKNKILNLEGQVRNINLRISTLESMEESLEGYNKSIRSFYNYLNKNNLEFNNLFGPLANLIEVPEKYEKAITTALGGASQNLVVEKFNDAKYLIEILRKNNLGRITFLPLDNIKFKARREDISHPGFIDYASDLIKYDNKYNELIDSLLGSIVVVDNLNSANEISKNLKKLTKIVTLDGDIINPGGSVTGGSIKTEGSIFNRKNELNKLKKTINLEYENIKNEKEVLDNLFTTISDEELEYNNLSSEIEKYKEDLKELNSKINKISYQKESINSHINKVNNEIETSNKRFIENEKELEILKSKVGNFESSDTFTTERLNNLKEEISRESLSRDKSRENLNSLKIEILNLDNKKSYLEKNIERLDLSYKKNTEEIDNNIEEIEKLKKEIDILESKISDSEIKLQNITKINSTYTDKLQNLERSRKDYSKKIEEINNKITDKREENFNLEKDIYFKDSKIEDINKKSSAIYDLISENYNSSLIDVDKEFIENNNIPSKNKIKTLKIDLNNLGPVNLGSIRAFSEIKERYEFNKNQYEDLTSSKKELEDFIKDIESTMEEKFKSSFEEINKNFNKSFKFLFGGGNAKLVLEESEDSLDAGVDIVAELPGKKQRLLSAMSGGERSLTTVALLFALLEANPSPFVLLDEIDAALDDSNIKRFLSYLDNLEDIQFALITHRKTTMAKADYIYGVTMEEPGVSKVLELSFKERSLKTC